MIERYFVVRTFRIYRLCHFSFINREKLKVLNNGDKKWYSSSAVTISATVGLNCALLVSFCKLKALVDKKRALIFFAADVCIVANF